MRTANWMAASIMMAAGLTAAAQTAVPAAPATTGTQTATAAAQQEVKRTIVISLQDRKLALIEDGQVKKVYSVAVGKPSTPSPVGTFIIQRRVVNPVYYHDGITVQPGPHNPVGDRWMGLNLRGYGIHGTNAPKSIGKAASHGCIRMAKPDIEELFALVKAGDTVELIGEPNQETARLFGPEPAQPVPAQQPVLSAHASAPASPAPAGAPSATARTASPALPQPAAPAAESRLALAMAAGGTR